MRRSEQADIEKEREENKLIEEIKRLYKTGKSDEDIKQELRITNDAYYNFLVRKAKKSNLWLTKKELEMREKILAENKRRADEKRKLENINEKKSREQQREQQREQKREAEINRYKQIKQLYGEGKSQRQIARRLGVEQANISIWIKKYKSEGIWFTEEELAKIEKNRCEKNKLKEQENKKIIKELYKQGMSQAKIGFEIDKSPSYVSKIIAILKNDGEWFTKEELANIDIIRIRKAKEKREQRYKEKQNVQHKEQIIENKPERKKGDD